MMALLQAWLHLAHIAPVMLHHLVQQQPGQHPCVAQLPNPQMRAAVCSVFQG